MVVPSLASARRALGGFEDADESGDASTHTADAETILRDAPPRDVPDGLGEDIALDDIFGLPESERRAKAANASVPPAASRKPAKESVWDAVEARYRADGHWTDLVEMYLQRVETARPGRDRSSLLKRIALVMENELDDGAQALDAWVEAFLADPGDEETARAVERLASRRECWGELFATLKRELREVKSKAREIAICEHAARWAQDEWKQPARAESFVERIRKLDPGHPLIQRRLAAQYADQGSHEAEREALERALLRETNDTERKAIYLALGAINEKHLADPGRAAESYEAALAIDARAAEALDGLERICRAERRSSDLAHVLERQIEAAGSPKSRAAVLLRLAEVHEHDFVRPQHAVAYLEEALRLDRGNGAALTALERCYHATRAWSDLVRVLELRIGLAESTRDQAAFISRVAELLDMQLGDFAGASKAWHRVWDLDPANEQALWELARLAERANDWPAAAAYRAKLADLAPSAEASAKIHVAIGELLDAPDRDPGLARKHYEKAASIHPATTQAWEALERGAREAGDAKRTALFLERRAASTEAPRLKAQLFVDLAAFHTSADDLAGAELAYERAIKADPTNELAAEAMLAVHVRARRWGDAHPLCDLLVTALPRDANDDRAVMLLRTASRIARELGHVDRAMVAAAETWRVRPTIEAAGDLVDACHEGRSESASLARVADAINDVAVHAMQLGPQRLCRLARVRQAQGLDDLALDLFGKALTHDAELRDAHEGLGEVLLARGDFERACAFKLKAAHAETDPEAQYKRLVDVGELWAHKAKNLPMAALALEEALVLKPRDSWLLHTLLWAYGELECWEKVIETLREVASLHDDDPPAKAKSVYAMALVVRDRLGDPTRAGQLLEEVLDLDPKRLDAFERVVRVHTELRDWPELKLAYGRMLRRLKTDGEIELKHALFFQLGLIYRDRLGDAARALDSFRAAQRLKPDSDDVRKSMSELLVVTDQIDDAIALVRTTLKRRPSDPVIYLELYSLFLRKRAFDQAWCALDAVATLGASLDAEQARFYADFPPPPLAQIPGTMMSTAWRSHIVHPELDPALTKIFAIITPIVLRARIAMVPFQTLRRSLGEPLRESSAVAHEVLSAVADGSEIVAISPPALHARDMQDAPLALAPAKNALFVSLVRCEALPSDALAFVVGKRLAELRPELAARAACPSLTELKGLVVLAVQLTDERRGAPTTGNAAFDKALVHAMTREEHLALRAALNGARAQGPELDVARWSQLADASTSRVGLLLAGRIEAARRGMLADVQSPGDPAIKDRLSELMMYGVSDAYAELRTAIGIGVGANVAE